MERRTRRRGKNKKGRRRSRGIGSRKAETDTAESDSMRMPEGRDGAGFSRKERTNSRDKVLAALSTQNCDGLRW